MTDLIVTFRIDPHALRYFGIIRFLDLPGLLPATGGGRSMIRDPSDGSVREAPKAEVGIPASKPAADPDSGLREASHKDTYQARLERSREWLKERNAQKAAK